MDKQMRVRFSGRGEEYQDDDSREGTIPPQKAISLKGDRKTDNWFQRQFSGQMIGTNDAEFLAAVAAAAYAVASQEEEEGSVNKKKSANDIASQEALMSKKRPTEELRGPLARIKSKREENMSKPTYNSSISRWFSSKEAKEDQKKSDETSQTKPYADPKLPEKTMGTTPTIRKTPTFSDDYLNDTGNKKDDHGQTGQQAPATIATEPPESFPRKGNDGSKATHHPSQVEAKAAAWEWAKMAKIQKKYEQRKSTILEWENEKKVKAILRLGRKERQLELRRARALQEYRNEVSGVDKIAGGARAVAEERRRDDEARAKKKATKMRSKGKVTRA